MFYFSLMLICYVDIVDRAKRNEEKQQRPSWKPFQYPVFNSALSYLANKCFYLNVVRGLLSLSGGECVRVSQTSARVCSDSGPGDGLRVPVCRYVDIQSPVSTQYPPLQMGCVCRVMSSASSVCGLLLAPCNPAEEECDFLPPPRARSQDYQSCQRNLTTFGDSEKASPKQDFSG